MRIISWCLFLNSCGLLLGQLVIILQDKNQFPLNRVSNAFSNAKAKSSQPARKYSVQKKVKQNHYQIQLIMMMISSIAALLLPIGISSCYFLISSSILLLLAIIDFNHLILPDCLTQTLLWLSLLRTVICESVSTENTIVSIALGYTLFWLLRNLGGMYCNREVIGGGDVKLVAALAGCLGWSLLPCMLIISCGITLVLVPFFKTKNIKERYPFGIGLAIAGIVLLFWRVYIEQSSGMYLPF